MQHFFSTLVVLVLVIVFGEFFETVSAQNSENCLAKTKEINAKADQDGQFQTNYSDLIELNESPRIHYQVNKIDICTSQDGQFILALRFGLGGYLRDDEEYLKKSIDISKLNE